MSCLARMSKQILRRVHGWGPGACRVAVRRRSPEAEGTRVGSWHEPSGMTGSSFLPVSDYQAPMVWTTVCADDPSRRCEGKSMGGWAAIASTLIRSEEHTSELQSHSFI